jgi:hypothetical protein
VIPKFITNKNSSISPASGEDLDSSQITELKPTKDNQRKTGPFGEEEEAVRTKIVDV